MKTNIMNFLFGFVILAGALYTNSSYAEKFVKNTIKNKTVAQMRSQYLSLCMNIPNVRKMDSKSQDQFCGCMAKKHLAKGLSQKDLQNLETLYMATSDVLPANADEETLFNFDLEAAELCLP